MKQSVYAPTFSRADYKLALRDICRALKAQQVARPYWRPEPELSEAWAAAGRMLASEGGAQEDET